MFPLLSVSLIKEWKNEFIELIKLPKLTTKNGLISELEYKNNMNKLHKNTNMGPAYISYYYDGKIASEIYYINGTRHRPSDKGPAIICYYGNCQIEYESYWVNDQKHRPLKDGPAYIYYHEDGQIFSEVYWVNNEIHNITY